MPSGSKKALSLALFIAFLATPLLVTAGENGQAVAALKPATNVANAGVLLAPPSPSLEFDTLILSAPPYQSPQVGRELYEPIAQYLSKAIGKKIIYRHPGTSTVYRTEVLKGSYDLLFEGPNFYAMDAQNLKHEVLIRAAEAQEWVVFVAKQRRTKLSDLTTNPVCASGAGVGVALLFNRLILDKRSPDQVYQGVVSGQCMAGLLAASELDDRVDRAQVVFKSEPLPGTALSAGPRVAPADQTKIVKALLAPDAADATERLRAALNLGAHFATAHKGDYSTVANLFNPASAHE